MDFEFSEDREYFDRCFTCWGGLDSRMDLFDFRDPELKRKEFEKIRNKVFEELKVSYGESCQLKCHEDCTGVATQVDHLIPLSSNELNKKLRLLKGTDGKKTISQSFGSNAITNFVLACKRCNAFKKHRFPDQELLRGIEQVRSKIS